MTPKSWTQNFWGAVQYFVYGCYFFCISIVFLIAFLSIPLQYQQRNVAHSL